MRVKSADPRISVTDWTYPRDMTRTRAAAAVVAGAALALCAACSSSAPQTATTEPPPTAQQQVAATPFEPVDPVTPKPTRDPDDGTLDTAAKRQQFARDMRAVLGTAGGLGPIEYLTIATTACDDLKTTTPDKEADRIAKGFTDDGIPSNVAHDVAMGVLSVSITEVCPSHLDAYLAAFPSTLGD